MMPNASTAGAPVLEISGLSLAIKDVRAVDGVSLSIGPGEALALVGESGCGKSLSSLAVMGLLPDSVRPVEGSSVKLLGRELLGLDSKEMDGLRGLAMSMIFQEPFTSLNPLMKVGNQITETLTVHGVPEEEARRRALEMLVKVGVPAPETRFGQFPFELSGGMCQRAMIALAMVGEPKLLIADEPTTALDVTIQAQILDLMRSLMKERGTALLLITHDMGVVAEVADRVAVMYAGRIVETGGVDDIFAHPSHPYTKLLLAGIPGVNTKPHEELRSISGSVPDIREWGGGCRFRSRCPIAAAVCAESVPSLVQAPPPAAGGHLSACHFSHRTEDL